MRRRQSAALGGADRAGGRCRQPANDELAEATSPAGDSRAAHRGVAAQGTLLDAGPGDEFGRFQRHCQARRLGYGSVSVLLRVLVTGLVVAAVAAPAAPAGTVFKFSPTNPKVGTEFAFVQPIRAQPLPSGAELPEGETQGVQLPEEASGADLYLVRNSDAPSIRGRDDERLIPLGHFSWAGSTLRCCPPDRSFPVRLKDVPPGNYAIAAWCAECTNQRLFVIGVGGLGGSGEAPLQLLRVPADEGIPYWPFLITLLVAASLLAGAALVRRRMRGQPERPPNRGSFGLWTSRRET